MTMQDMFLELFASFASSFSPCPLFHFALLSATSILPVFNIYQSRLYSSSFFDRFFGLDDRFLGEVLGKAISGKARNRLDEISDATGISLKSCQRQVNNQ